MVEDSKDYFIINSIVENEGVKGNIDSQEEINVTRVVDNQFQNISIIVSLISVAMYSLINIISESSTYISYFITYGEITIPKTEILTYFINIAGFVLIIILLMLKSSMKHTKFVQFSSLFIGIGIGLILYLIKMKREINLNNDPFSFLFFWYGIPYILFYLSIMNDIYEKSWLFSIGLFFLGLFSILILISLTEFSLLLNYLQNNVIFTIIWILEIIVLFLYLFLIKNRKKINTLFKKNYDKNISI